MQPRADPLGEETDHESGHRARHRRADPDLAHDVVDHPGEPTGERGGTGCPGPGIGRHAPGPRDHGRRDDLNGEGRRVHGRDAHRELDPGATRDVEHATDADDDPQGEHDHLEGPPAGRDGKPADGILGGTDERRPGQQHHDAGRDDEGGREVGEVDGQVRDGGVQRDGDESRDRRTDALQEERREPPPVERPEHPVDDRRRRAGQEGDARPPAEQDGDRRREHREDDRDDPAPVRVRRRDDLVQGGVQLLEPAEGLVDGDPLGADVPAHLHDPPEPAVVEPSDAGDPHERDRKRPRPAIVRDRDRGEGHIGLAPEQPERSGGAVDGRGHVGGGGPQRQHRLAEAERELERALHHGFVEPGVGRAHADLRAGELAEHLPGEPSDTCGAEHSSGDSHGASLRWRTLEVVPWRSPTRFTRSAPRRKASPP